MPDSGPLRLVLFGLPGAGKSSLLGALPQAAEVQPHLLNGRLADPSPNLTELRRRVYDPDHGPAATGEEVVPYSFAYERAGSSGRIDAVALDCDGRMAEALIQQAAPAVGTLAREMLHADAIVLAVDASAPPERLDAEFAEFDQFLRWMERHRGERTDVAGLPLFLVLTKCDRLARPGETTADWLEHIEQRKREIGDHFRGFLAVRDAGRQPAAFGRIHVHLWATAVLRPPLAGAAARPTDPYGVAELFRQCLDQAAAFRRGRERSAHRLVQMTLASAGGVLGLLAVAGLLVATDALHREPTALEIRIESLRDSEPTTLEERLRGSPDRLQPRLAEWQAIRDASDFTALSAELRSYVEDRRSELEAYLPWLEGLEETPRPREALTEEELRGIQARLSGPLAAPRPGWDDTDAGRVRQKLSAEADALLSAMADLRKWYRDAYKAGDDLWLSAGQTRGGPSWNGWARDVEGWLATTETPPDADPTRPLARDPSLTYADVKDFGSVTAARAQWEGVRERLGRLRDVAAALGLIEGLKGKPAVLVVPANGLTLAQTTDRFRELQTTYPKYQTTFVQDRDLPPVVASELRDRARAYYQLLLEPARALVLAKLRAAKPGDDKPPDAESPERWRPVREWLAEPKELAGWRGLALTLARLADAEAPDPVDALGGFLDKKSFPLKINDFTLVIPDELDLRPRSDQALKVYSGAAEGGALMEWVFRPVGDGVRVGQQPLREYHFQAAKPDQTLDYVPGAVLYAVLPLGGPKAFRWDRSRSRLYRFEALSRRPVLLEGEPPSVVEGRPADGVRLQPQPEDGIPAVPDLMPRVDFQ